MDLKQNNKAYSHKYQKCHENVGFSTTTHKKDAFSFLQSQTN